MMNKQRVLILMIGLSGFVFIKYVVEPVVIKEACSTFVKCEG